MKFTAKLFALTLLIIIFVLGMLVTLVDPNDYKPQIQEIAEQKLNRKLLLTGDLAWTLFPRLGLSVGEFTIKNPSTFDTKDLLLVKSASIDIDVMPLFKGEIQFGMVKLNGLQVNLVSTGNGKSNLDNIGSPSEKTSKNAEQPISKNNITETNAEEEAPFFKINNSSIDGVKITNTTITHQDLVKKSISNIKISEINIGHFSIGKKTTLELSTNMQASNLNVQFDLKSTLLISKHFSEVHLTNLSINSTLKGKDLPKESINLQLSTDLLYEITKKRLELSKLAFKVDDIDITGELSIQDAKKVKVRYKLFTNKIDLTPYIPAQAATQKPIKSTKKNKQTVSPVAKQKPALSKVEPDLTFINDLDIKGDLVINGLIFKKIKIGKITNHLIINNGKMKLKPLTAQLYSGTAYVDGTVSSNNKYQITTKVSKLKALPLLSDSLDVNSLSGIASFNFKGKGTGLSEYKIMHKLSGRGAFKLTEGKLYGINISQELRVFKAKLSDQYTENKNYQKQTDFASLKGGFNIKKGIIRNQHLTMQSPVATLQGKGVIQLIPETLDYKLNIKPKNKSKSKNQLTDFSNISIPLLIKGSFTNPQFSIDSDAALKALLKEKEAALKLEAKKRLKKDQDKLQKKLDKQLDKHLDKETKDKVNKEVNRIFNKWLN